VAIAAGANTFRHCGEKGSEKNGMCIPKLVSEFVIPVYIRLDAIDIAVVMMLSERQT
jgi:hypothetical protein